MFTDDLDQYLALKLTKPEYDSNLQMYKKELDTQVALGVEAYSLLKELKDLLNRSPSL